MPCTGGIQSEGTVVVVHTRNKALHDAGYTPTSCSIFDCDCDCDNDDDDEHEVAVWVVECACTRKADNVTGLLDLDQWYKYGLRERMEGESCLARKSEKTVTVGRITLIFPDC